MSSIVNACPHARSDDPSKTEAGNSDDDAFVCYAVRPLAPGQELAWVYNSHRFDCGWLTDYGFVPCDGRSSQPWPAGQLPAECLGTGPSCTGLRGLDSVTHERIEFFDGSLPSGMLAAIQVLLRREREQM
jgi:hypothetical protein